MSFRALSLLILLFTSAALWGGQISLPPLDPATVTGTLDNGIRYYIVHNPTPANRVEMRLVVQAGSLQETSAEKGLAHLVEHMEFQGTDHFGAQEIVGFLQSQGMRFGADLNALTGEDFTEYFLKVPTGDPGILKKGLSILEDWAHGPRVDDTRLENEKKVVAEENRLTGKQAGGRLQQFTLSALYEGSAWADHFPIGDMAQVQGFTASDIRRFVDTWYTPKSLSLVVVGDIDPPAFEKTLRETFKGTFTNQGAPGPAPLPPLGSVSADTTSFINGGNFTYVEWIKTQPHSAQDGESTEDWNLVSAVALYALNNRFQALSQKTGSGFLQAAVHTGWLPWPNALVDFVCIPRSSDLRTQALTTFLTELKKAAVYGLTQSEFDLSQKAFEDGNNLYPSAKTNVSDTDQADALVQWITTGQPVSFTDPAWRYRTSRAAALTRKEVNDWLARYILPTPARILAVSWPTNANEAAAAQALEAFQAEVLEAPVRADAEQSVKPLVSTTPTPGKVVKKELLDGTPFEQWTLSNGLRVYLDRNSHTKDDFQVRAFAPGGLTTLDDTDYQVARMGLPILDSTGAGDLDTEDLRAYLTGKRAEVHFSIDDDRATVTGTSDPDDPDDMLRFFQLLNRRFAGVHRSPGAEQLALRNLAATLPGQNYRDLQTETEKLLTNEAPRTALFTTQRAHALGLDKVENLDRAAALERRFFADAKGFTFLMTGDFHEETLQPLVETWLGSLPAHREPAEHSPDLGIRPVPGPVTKVFHQGGGDKADVLLVMEVPVPYSTASYDQGTVLEEVLNIRLLEVLRQTLGGVYTAKAWVDLEPTPYPRCRTSVQFTCAPENQNSLVKAVQGELQAIAEGHLGDEVFTQGLEIRKRDIEAGEKTNGYWTDVLYWSLVLDNPPAALLQRSGSYQNISKADILGLAARLLTPGKALVVIQDPY